ncbi:hypothetical protein [Deinococcus multiflagellatus]|uniref:Uncharacterized protein n=1 Tax=Deinococcus multiflagellatus TaxID=1656887 RepID=A0ABW1ZTG5_9DEIO|nr:hypothetical protein [Deinococcus multiflagellatus]
MTHVVPLRPLIGLLILVLAFGATGMAQDPCWKCAFMQAEPCYGC